METAANPDARRALPIAIKATGGTSGTPATGDPPPVGTADEPRTAGVGVRRRRLLWGGGRRVPPLQFPSLAPQIRS